MYISLIVLSSIYLNYICGLVDLKQSVGWLKYFSSIAAVKIGKKKCVQSFVNKKSTLDEGLTRVSERNSSFDPYSGKSHL